MSGLLYAICFISGAAAIALEQVFFRKAGLFFGNGVWATSVVLAAFMAGLALGSLVAARRADRVRRPLFAYACAELVVAAAGAGVVVAMAPLGAWLAPRMGRFLDEPTLINVVRLAAAFALMCVPTTAMGATLPFLVRAASKGDRRIGVVLGLIYGWNTLGATAGALAGETLLYASLGVTGTGLAAAAGSLAAALLATLLSRRLETAAAAPVRNLNASPSPRLLLTALLSGALLLSLEVMWARFLQLFLPGTSLVFAILLAVVLAGISLGGLAAGALLARWPEAHRWTAACAFGAGFLVAGSYAWLRSLPEALAGDEPWQAATVMTMAFALPVSVVSGMIFTFVGAAIHDQTGRSGWSVGVLTFANTVGAMTGALLAGFVLLPGLGVERSILCAAFTYGLLALLVPRAPWTRPALWGVAALWLAAIALFPHRLMQRVYLALPIRPHLYDGGEVAAIRESVTETIIYVEAKLAGFPYEHRLITNNYNMSASSVAGRRYMKLYVYLPAALHPRLEKALLISYGVGSTAKALTDSRELRSIDVVDISKDILDLSSIVFPDSRTHPLHDPRVKVHVEDGRYFLQATQERYDLITAEPPPPKMAGVVNLYSQEFFELVRERLSPGGFATYWLPLHSLEPQDAWAITASFCRAFPDCTLWKGSGLSWMLVGTRGAVAAVTPQRFTEQWSDPVVREELTTLGFERPAQLGALFIADAEQLSPYLEGVLPLTDDHPHRLRPARRIALPKWYVPVADTARTRQRFVDSAWVSRLWPEPIREAAVPDFEWQAMYDRTQFWDRHNTLADLHRVLAGSDLEALPLLLLESTRDVQRIAAACRARGDDTAFVWHERAKERLVQRDYAAAAEAFRETLKRSAPSPVLQLRLAYALWRAGRRAEARAALPPASPDIQVDLDFLAAHLGH